MPKTHKKNSILLAILLAAVLTIPFAKTAEAADGKADFRKIFLSMPEYIAAQRQYIEMAKQKAVEYDRLTANAKDEQTKQQLKKQHETWQAQTNVEIMTPVVNKAKQVIHQVAADRKLQHIYDSQSSEAAKAETDVTADVITRLAQDRARHTADDTKQPAKTEAKPQPKPVQPVQTVKAKPAPVAENKPAKAEAPAKAAKPQVKQPAKAEKPQVKPQTVSASGGATIIQFGADTEPDEMRQWVAKAKKNGIASAHVEENVNSKGRKWWRARATANSKEEAEAICAKLKAIGLKYYIVR